MRARVLGTVLVGFFLANLVVAADAQQLRPPAHPIAGKDLAMATSGSGAATFYLLGPSAVVKKKIELGSEVQVDGDSVRGAGRYTAIACASECSSVNFFVAAAEPARLSFLVHPSRVPVAAPDAISAVAFVFDKFRNPVLAPSKVDFHITLKDAPEAARSIETKNGIAWIRMASTKHEGPAQVVASFDQTSDKRIVQQVASDACNLRIHATRNGDKVEVQTDPVRDCSGNAVPDGTVVSFTAVGPEGKTTVDAPVKKGVARAQIPVQGTETVSVASGVAMGNEITIGGTR